MLNILRVFPILAFFFPAYCPSQEMHDHGVPERLGSVSFPISCKTETQEVFNRGVALLHSFAYKAAADAFKTVADRDPQCAMAHWGIAMTYFHQLWEPPLSPSTIPVAQAEIRIAQNMSTPSKRERQFIDALANVYQDASSIPYRTRATNYEHAMSNLAADDQNDMEAQIFFALALISNASPSDKTHTKQKQAADLLEPLYRRFPEHPGIPHYLIHAYDNAELAPRGLSAARVYAQIAPSAPHALHMPSHIFTRLGLWDDSIASNLAAKDAAHRQGDTGEELHAMDYLVYAYLQKGRDTDAAQVVEQLKAMPTLNSSDFKIDYAATAIPIRYAVERHQWKDTAAIALPPDAAVPQIVGIAVWARGLGFARSKKVEESYQQFARLQQIEEQLRTAGNDYWANQTKILALEVKAWLAQADNRADEALASMRIAADEEDAIEKLPVTPGPIVPAREQLGEMLLEQGHSDLAFKEFQTALSNAPGRRGALQGAAQAARLSGEK